MKMKVKRVASPLLLLLAVLLFSHPASSKPPAQQETDGPPWEQVSPANDAFTVAMPQLPFVTVKKKQHGELNFDARIYASKTRQGAAYIVWSLDSKSPLSTAEEVNDYLDSCVELIWNDVLEPQRADDRRRDFAFGDLSYVSDLKPAATFSGREYRLGLGTRRGVLQIYYAGPHVYVLMALSAEPSDADLIRRFINSFKLTGASESSMGSTEQLKLVAAAQGASVSTAALSPLEVTQKAHILFSPEPQYTEPARKYQVSGTVVLSAILSSGGEVTDIRVVKGLPHGLTRASMEAVRRIRFEPALKDNRPVSQSIQVEYNYNVY
jgi:TonB family protein